MKKYLFLMITSLFCTHVFADCPDGYVICQDGTRLTFGQTFGFFKCNPIDSEKNAAIEQCKDRGGVAREDEGWWQQNTEGKVGIFLNSALEGAKQTADMAAPYVAVAGSIIK